MHCLFIIIFLLPRKLLGMCKQSSVYILLWFLYCTDILMFKKIPRPASGQIPFSCGQNFALFLFEVFCAIYYLTN